MQTLAEGVVSALPAAEITIIAYGKIPKVEIYEEKSNFREKYINILACYLLNIKENEFDRLLLFSRGADPAGRGDYRFLHNVKEKDTDHPSNPNLGRQMLYNRQKVNECKSYTT